MSWKIEPVIIPASIVRSSDPTDAPPPVSSPAWDAVQCERHRQAFIAKRHAWLVSSWGRP